MGMTFDEVTVEDFSRIGGERASFLLIEDALVDIGGQGVNGTRFKVDALRAAGWGYGKLVTYASKAEKATEAFNKVRGVLADTTDKDEVLSRLQQG